MNDDRVVIAIRGYLSWRVREEEHEGHEDDNAEDRDKSGGLPQRHIEYEEGDDGDTNCCYQEPVKPTNKN